jgi:hypothetical protein
VTRDDTELVAIGLRRGDTVRFRRSAEEHWKEASVMRRERDGSIGLRDENGASRAIAMDLIEVRTAGPRGGIVWDPLVERARRSEQLRLL